MRKYLIAGNWKMNKNPDEGADLVAEIHQAVGRQTDVQVAVCPPFTAIDRVGRKLDESNILVGAQNMHHEAGGAYTGEVSAGMLRSLFCTFVIVGHSERRAYFAESDSFINAKVNAALASNLKPILCVGETLEEREAARTLEVVTRHVTEGLRDVGEEHAENVVIAYEPVWAIGTGKTATPEMAQEVHAAIRKLLVDHFGEAGGQRIRILYGGSMKPENASELLDQPDVDGGLIGGASLTAAPFIKLVEIAREKR